MIRALLGIVVSGAVGAVMLVLMSWLSAAGWRLAGRRTARLSPRVRAHALAAWRLFPVAASCVTALVTLLAFLHFEPQDSGETLGFVLPTVFGAGLIAVAAGLVRVARAVRQTVNTVRAWGAEHAGTACMLPVVAVDTPFPIVAVVGIWKPRLFVARQVVAECDRAELEAMIDHEVAHVEARDNLTRLLFVGAPLAPFTSETFRDLENAWITAAEEAADDAARRAGRSAIALASALIKVARLATGRAPLVHASAILSGRGVEHRVRRLLDTLPEARGRGRGTFWACGLATATAFALWQPIARSAYDAAEYCVRNLP